VTDLLVLGGSGRTGAHVLSQAIERGHNVRALVRDPDKLQAPPGVELVRGTPSSIDDLRRAAEGTRAVAVALNNGRASDNPWARPTSPSTFMTGAVRDTLAVMEENGIGRIGIVSAFGVGDSWRTVNPLFKAMVKASNIRHGYRDHDGVDDLVRAADLDWTLVRPVALTDRPPSGPLRAAEAGTERPGLAVSRSEVARFLLDEIEQGTWTRRAPLIWNERRARRAGQTA